jgi:hypothetical protein
MEAINGHRGRAMNHVKPLYERGEWYIPEIAETYGSK